MLRVIDIAAKIVNREVNKAGVVDILGDNETENIQGESSNSWMFMQTSSLLQLCKVAENAVLLFLKKMKIIWRDIYMSC